MRQCQVNFCVLPRPFEPLQIYLITFSIKIFEIFTKILSRLRRFDGNSSRRQRYLTWQISRVKQFKVTFLTKNHIFLKVQTFWKCVNELGSYSIFRVKRLGWASLKFNESSNTSQVHQYETCLSQIAIAIGNRLISSRKDYAAFSAWHSDFNEYEVCAYKCISDKCILKYVCTSDICYIYTRFSNMKCLATHESVSV